MPTRKQRRRQAKEKRHEQGWYEIDEYGNEVELDPEELRKSVDVTADHAKSRNGSKPAAPAKPTRGRAGRAGRTPQAPSWQRASKRAALLGVIVFVLFGFSAAKSHHGWATAAVPAVIYTALFIPFTYMIDRFAYRRYEARRQSGGTTTASRPAKKR